MAALRSLMIELGLADDVSNKLRGIDSQIDGMQSGLIDTQSGFDDLGRATTEYGRVAGDEIEGVEKEVTELDKQIEQSADVTAEAAADMATSWGKVGAAIGAAAAATELYLRSQQDMYFTGAKIAYITGMDRREVTGLASDLTNLSFSLEDAYGVMEVGARQGLRTRSELEKYAQTWDAIATASSEDAATLAQAGIALRSVGVAAGEEEEALDALGFVMQKTQMDTSDFLRLTGYMARDMDLYEMSINDVAVTLAALEERGLGSREAQRELRSAMTNAKGDVTALYRELGITEGQLSRLNEEIDGGEEYIASMGEAFADAQTPLQWLQMQIGKTAHVLGNEFNPLLEAGSLVMTGASTAMLTGASAAYLYSVASTSSLVPSLAAATTSAWAFTASLLANPITWIVLGIVGLGVALYLLASNWDDVSGWFMDRWEQVGSVATGAIDWIGGTWDSTVGAIVAGADWLGDKLQFFGLLFPFAAPIAGMHLLRDNWDSATGAIAGGWDWLVSTAADYGGQLKDMIGGALSGISDLFWQYHPLGIIIRQWDEITGYLESIDLFAIGRDLLLGLVRGILDVRQQVIDAAMGIGEALVESVTGFFGIRSPSKLMQEMGHHVGEGFALGVGESMPESIPLPDAIEGSIRPGPVPGGYATVWTEPTAPSLAGEAVYSSTLTEPMVGDLAGRAIYSSTLTEPVVGDLAGRVAYSSTLTEPVVEGLVGRAIYSSTLTEPVVGDLAGRVAYSSTLTEPVVGDLTGAITYLAKVIEPVISALTGELTYETHVSEPTIVDRAGTVVYETEMSEPTIAALTGAITYVATVLEPAIPLLTGAVTYLSEALAPEVPALAGTIEYGATLPEQGNLDRAGEVSYTPTIAEPAIDTLAGLVEYQGVLVGLPDVNDLTGQAEFGGREINDTRASWGPETDNPPDPLIYTPERDAPYMAGERSGDLVYSPTIHVTTGTSDANEIATTVDRRLRQTFDRHAELYFARQRRRAAL